MRADIMLAWMSETGTGDIQDLRQRITWFARTADVNPTSFATGQWLRDLSALGHAEIDWDRGRWGIAPAAAALLPASDGTVVIAGRRPLGLVEGFEDDFAVRVTEHDASEPALRAPSSVYLQTDSLSEMEQLLAHSGVRYVGCAAQHLAERLLRLQLGAPAAPPAWGTPTEHLTISSSGGIDFVAGPPDGDGLCRFLVQGRHQYRYRRGNNWSATERAHGIWWTLADRQEQVIRWRKERQVGDEAVGTLFVDQGAPLPPLQARALVLCSGLLTKFSTTARTAIYKNVPLTIAELVAWSVRQHVVVID